MVTGLDIASSVANHYKNYWELTIRTPELKTYLETETVYENTVSTDVFTLAIISAAQDFQYSPLTEYDIAPSIAPNSKRDPLDVVWVSKLPKPATRDPSVTKNIILGSEIEMGDNQLKAIKRLLKLENFMTFANAQEPWKMLCTWKDFVNFERFIPRASDRSGRTLGDRWIFITEDPNGWLTYHDGNGQSRSIP